jgi:hypothetical protein
MKKNKMTTAQVLTEATGKLSDEISKLTEQRDQSLSIFRSTAENLTSINARLTGTINKMDEMVEFINTQRDAASKVISDNSQVVARIYEIIGK